MGVGVVVFELRLDVVDLARTPRASLSLINSCASTSMRWLLLHALRPLAENDGHWITLALPP